MRIACPFCGERDHQEFSYLGDASVVRPQTPVAALLDEATLSAWHDYVYLRENGAVAHREFWYHGAGCHQWLVVTRDLRTHDITAVETAHAVHGRSGA